MTRKGSIFITIALGLAIHLTGIAIAQDAEKNPKLEINRPTPKSDSKAKSEEFKLRDPKELYTRTFKTPPTGHPPSYEQLRRIKSPQKILEEHGVEFPEGASAKYEWDSGLLTITNNEMGMAMIESYIDHRNHQAEQTIIFQVEIYRLPALLVLELQDSASKHSDHTPERDAVHALTKKGGARLVTSVNLKCRSGQRAKSADSIVHRYVDHYEWQEDNKKVLPVFESRPTGTIFEVDPVMGADNSTIDISFHLEHHTAPPEQEKTRIRLPNSDSGVEFFLPVFHAKTIVTQLTMKSGTMQIIGVYRPSGKSEYDEEDLMDIAFLKANMVTTEIPLFPIKQQ
jgi:hypothetical protein